ncbi:toll/interleukin-1 receptor domain-containing protein [Thiothrix subterranea]|uniref:Toll/interleukin-1 receptor domain-containing protein n=1 Tax=Thiothrix subterranea TaxID=2735563 RepID=A0AA51R4N7_9GAMM|nr:toll/interleukin-1 receptor domain-containing protein [Thiothrix subterranea]MDQ5770466.1 toll/interleukin-1 receptor domain-containing protein [Thiothrix subterranea]QQZ28297.1 toll/interleukin-1 receptor domain-containing protein [Thiothrix subterranea]WML86856.1 toll/interleukin-1 receptor domain-containing protein [Thiothrix subterranea]
MMSNDLESQLVDQPIKAFVSYSQKDEKYLTEFSAHMRPLLRLKQVVVWDDRAIDVGDEWEECIYRELDEADIVICLVSSDFIASDFCYEKELDRALDAHRKGQKVVVPVLLRSCFWKELPLSKLGWTPRQWITSHENRDEAWTEVVTKLRKIILDIKK